MYNPQLNQPPIKVLLLVTGGIAAYKSCILVRRLLEVNGEVQVAMTEMATQFVSPLTFEALSGKPVATKIQGQSNAMEHISLAEWADVVVVAPATANTLAEMAWGLANDLVSTLLLVARCPILVAPAMNTLMWEHPATQQNITTLQERGIHIIPPGEGILACRHEGAGKMAEPEEIVDWVLDAFAGGVNVRGLRFLVSAGPTQEFFDPFRFLSNPSSGTMGVAIAASAARGGAQVTLVHGPISLATPRLAQSVAVTSAAEMGKEILSKADSADILIMSAAVADFTPKEYHTEKVKKSDLGNFIELQPTMDILATLGARRSRKQVFVGFCAETSDIEARAKAKLEQKNVDLIVANNINEEGSGFRSPTNRVTLYYRNGRVDALPLQSKRSVALHILRAAKDIWDRF